MSDASDLLEVVWTGLLAGVGLSVIFALVIAAVTRAGTAHRDGRTGAAVVQGAIAVVASLLCLGAVALALITMLSK
ncbi:hypothetical protein [Patulibacter defluvii]|uniref:hypothetical protein n=1 Tax=Patulibacter defluvii TaxID=3095358 RepID=UPI002A74BD91|nr:hypothetical protein [Patulibacter sp. DM4]